MRWLDGITDSMDALQVDSLPTERPGKPQDRLGALKKLRGTSILIPGVTNSQSWLKLTFSVMPSSHLILCRPLLLLPTRLRVLSAGRSSVCLYEKNPPAMQETPVQILGWEDPLEKGQATHSSILGLLLQLSW